jgi:tetratricopeptide (TPR) repeat protein
MPLLATASLIVVQRMTTLSALFMLLGLSGYLFARSKVDDNPHRGLAGMSASLVAGTVLATLCKESGLLLPVLVLVLEATVLERPTAVNARHWRIWQFVFLGLPLTLLVLYLAVRGNYPDSLVASRDFNAWERLLTEARILWIYLLKALVGIPSQLGIYQQLPAISRSLFSPVTFVACVAWLALLLASIVWRRRYPLFAVAVLWYLAGHLIESTVVPLELYFEHRNYVPIIGPLFALASYLILRPVDLRRIAGVLIPVYVFANAWFLYSFASLSGEPSNAARYWADKYPGSQRAVSRMARYQLEEEGPLPALQTIDAFISQHPEHAYMRIPQLNLLCQYASDQDHRAVAKQVQNELIEVDFSYTAARMLFELLNTASRSTCNGVDPGTVVSLAATLRDNPRYTNEPLYNQFYRKSLAIIAQQQGDYDAAIEHLEQALAFGQSMELNLMIVVALGGAGDFAAARQFVDEAETLGPVNPVKAVKWRRDLDALREYIRKLEQNAQT